MKYFKFIMLMATVAGAAVSCNSIVKEPVPAPSETYGPVKFNVANSLSYKTRSISTDFESDVNNLSLVVFNPDNEVCAFGRSDQDSITLNVPLGKPGYSVFALANSTNDITRLTKKSDILSQLSTFKNKGDLEMFKVTDNLMFTSGQGVDIQVERFASKIVIDTIINAIPSNPVFVIDSIYLYNISSKCLYDYSVPELAQVQKAGLGALCCDTTATSLSKGEKYEVSHSFYCYPNPVTEESDGGKFTRLVVAVSYNSHKYYYPVNIPGEGNGTIDHNTLYRVRSLTITGPGSTSPDVPVSKEYLRFAITVTDWTDGGSQVVTI